MKIVFLDAKTVGNVSNLSKLNDFGELILFDYTSKELTINRIANCNVAITNKVIIDKNVMEHCPDLKLICVAATGMNNVDITEANARGIIVKNVKGYSTESVVQATFSLIFNLINHTAYYDEIVKNGEYSNCGSFTLFNRTFWELAGKNFGIIGLGSIGKRVAEVAKSFGCNVQYYSTSGNNYNTDFKQVTLEELLKTSHIISIHSPLNDKTNNLLTINQLQLMRKEAILINTGRGGIVNESDLAIALDNEIISGAGIDVFTSEPIPENNPLLFIKNKHKLCLTPHNAWASIEARERLIDGIYENIVEFLKK